MKFKIATWNIGSLFSDYEKNIKVIESFIKSVNADVFCIQELPDDSNIISAILEWGNFISMRNEVCCPSHITQGLNVGIGIFAKSDILETGYTNLPKPTGCVPIFNGKREVFHEKKFMFVRTNIANEQVLIITGHGFPFHRYRINEDLSRSSLEYVDRWIAELKKKYRCNKIYIACDMNVHDAVRFMSKCNKSMTDAFENEPTRPSGRKTDAILISKTEITIKKTNLITGFDHNVIAVELDI